MGLRDERGGVVKWVIGLALVGVLLFDAGSIIVNFFSLDATADDIAIEVSTSAAQNFNITPAALEKEAEQIAKDKEARLVDFEYGTDKVIRLTVRRRARTIVVGRIGPIKDWARATADGQASAVSN